MLFMEAMQDNESIVIRVSFHRLNFLFVSECIKLQEEL